MPFSFARVLQFSVISAKLLRSFPLKLSSGETGMFTRRWTGTDAGVANDETFDDENERKL